MKAQIIEKIEKIMKLHLLDVQMQVIHKMLNEIIPDTEENSMEELNLDYWIIFKYFW